MKRKEKAGSFEEFKKLTLDVVTGKTRVDPDAPKIWLEPVAKNARGEREIRFSSLEAGAKLLSRQNRMLLRMIAEQHPKSVSELVRLTGRAEPNLLRTLHKLSDAGLVDLKKGEGRAYRPVVTARKVHFEIDLLG